MTPARFRQLLEDGDADALRSAWAQAAPGMPQVQSRGQAEIVMHMARTGTERVGFRYRAYSHRWLTERNLPSQLPDRLRPRAERMYPQVVEAVGISVNFTAAWLKPAKPLLEKVMGDAVEDCFANGDRDPELVRSRMLEARVSEERSLFGSLPGRS